jgi:tetratricopeptide (TPR) repeat protein
MRTSKLRLAATLALVAGGCACVALGQSTTPPYTPGTYQTANPANHTRNPFYFEGRVDWELLKITTPTNAWEFAQRGIYEQDDLEDIPAAIADYKRSISLNSLDNGSCQLITSATVVSQGKNLDPPPCMFTVRLRLGNLLIHSDPEQAIHLFHEVLEIDPLRLGVNILIGEAYETLAEEAPDKATKETELEEAIKAFKAELALSPVTELGVKLTGDEANNARVHWILAHIYEELGKKTEEEAELELYLKATQWHSDTYPWRIELAKKRLGR